MNSWSECRILFTNVNNLIIAGDSLPGGGGGGVRQKGDLTCVAATTCMNGIRT